MTTLPFYLFGVVVVLVIAISMMGSIINKAYKENTDLEEELLKARSDLAVRKDIIRDIAIELSTLPEVEELLDDE